jgi:GTP:adenosylcobinamide-phosphate guanylyltransferase
MALKNMQALVNAGGKGTRMGPCGIEKPMQVIGGKPVVMRVIEALRSSKNIDRILVSVSDNTPETEKYLKTSGIETIRTSGESFVDDIHEAFKTMDGQFVLICPSDLPLLSTVEIDALVGAFDEKKMESLIALVSCNVLRKLGVTPSYTMDLYGSKWVLSGISLMDRIKTLKGEYLQESFFETESEELAVNVNTQEELRMARDIIKQIEGNIT